jgi:hypothetical protein
MDSSGASACQDCAEGKFSHQGKTQCADDCPAGWYGDIDDHCEMCPAGRWSSTVGAVKQSECIACPLGKFGKIAGATASACEDCKAGSYSDERGMSECTPCASGRWGTVTGATSTSTCSGKCEAGKSQGPGGSSNKCTNCSPGTYTESGLSGTLCQNCSAGTYSGAYGAKTEESCRFCPQGKTSLEASSSILDCVVCEAGRYSPSSGSPCYPCPPGSYESSVASVKCSPCPSGRFASGEGYSMCTACEAGSYSTEGAAECSLCAS